MVGELEKFGKTKRNKSKSRKLETFKNINIKYYIERRQKKEKKEQSRRSGERYQIKRKKERTLKC